MSRAHEPRTKVLIVDNDPAALKLYGEMLTEYSFEVLAANDGEAAFQLFCEHEPPVVVTDVHMPGFGGEELFGRIKGVRPDACIIFFTGWSDLTTAIRLVKKGAADYLVKPVSLDTLMTAIRQALSHRTIVPPQEGGDADLREMIGTAALLRDGLVRLCDEAPPDSTLTETLTLALEHLQRFTEQLDEARHVTVKEKRPVGRSL